MGAAAFLRRLFRTSVGQILGGELYTAVSVLLVTGELIALLGSHTQRKFLDRCNSPPPLPPPPSLQPLYLSQLFPSLRLSRHPRNLPNYKIYFCGRSSHRYELFLSFYSFHPVVSRGAALTCCRLEPVQFGGAKFLLSSL